MPLSVNTNPSALQALQVLNQTNRDLDQTQTKISTGLEVSGDKDNAAIYTIAQRMRAEIKGFDAIDQGFARAISTMDVALSAGETIADLMIEMKNKALSAADPSLDTQSRLAYDDDFLALRDQIRAIVTAAEFNGFNLIDGVGNSILSVLSSTDGQSSLDIEEQNLTEAGSILTYNASTSLRAESQALNALSELTITIDNIHRALSSLGSTLKQFEAQQVFINKLQDNLTVGVGNLVDADLAKESANLQALQIKQQLGTQSVGIANQRPQQILSLFGG